MNTNVLKMSDYQQFKKKKTREKVFEALETIHCGVLQALQEDAKNLDPVEMEEFYIQMIADHLLRNLDSESDLKRVTDHYLHFDTRLRDCLQHQIKTFRRFM